MGTIRPPAHISAKEMAAPVQSRKKSQPPKFLSSFGVGSIPAIFASGISNVKTQSSKKTQMSNPKA
jgi:hypothetical protein